MRYCEQVKNSKLDIHAYAHLSYQRQNGNFMLHVFEN